MKEKIKDLLQALEEVQYRSRFIQDDSYWIEEAKKVGFVPDDKPWVHYEITLWRIEISVYSNWGSSPKMVKYFINGEWFETSFPAKYPSIFDYITHETQEVHHNE